MREFLIRYALHRLNSQTYQKRKNFIRQLLTNRETTYTRYFDVSMILLILVSVGIMVFDANPNYSIPNWLKFFDFYIISTFFLIEYLVRFWVHGDIYKQILEHHKQGSSSSIILGDIIKRKFLYIISLPAIIDFLAIFPQFRMIRLLKLYHYLYGAKTLLKALSKKEFEFKFLAYILLVVIFSFASMLYIAEAENNDKINSFLDAIYWALVTLSTVGYGDITPITDIGKAIAMIGIVLGIAMISFVTSVMVSAFAERFDELRTHSSINQLQSMHNVVVINGYGYLGSRIAYYIQKEGIYSAVVIEEDKEKFNQAFNSSYVTIYGDGCSEEMIYKLSRYENIVAMFTLKSSDIENIYFILNAKSHNENLKVFSRITHKHLRLQYESIGTDSIIDPYAIIHKRAFCYSKNHFKGADERRVILFGFGQKSRNLAHKFFKDGFEIYIYDNNSEYIEIAKEMGFPSAHQVDFENEEDMHHLHNFQNSLVICSMDDEAINHYLAISLKVDGFYGKIIALSDTKQSNRQLRLAGVDIVFDIYDESAKEFIEQLKGVHT